MSKNTKRTILLSTAVVIMLAAGAAVSLQFSGSADASVPAPVEQAIPVVAVTVQQQQVQAWSGFSGRLRAVDYAEIRPEVSGRIMAVKFDDGQMVKTGDVLMIVDPRPYEAAVAKAEADLLSASTNATFAHDEMERAAALIKTEAISKSLYDSRSNTNRMAQASKAAAEASLQQAKLDLDHAYVKAPISGRISRAEVTIGNLVQAGPGAPLLTSIASLDGIYADFDVDEQTYMQSIHRPDQDTPQPAIAVEMILPGDTQVSYKGEIKSFDNRIDTASGTIRARAIFANEDHNLIPGMTISVRLADSNNMNALLVPEAAIGTDQDKRFVYAIGQDNRVAYHPVTLGRQIDGQRVVLSGLEGGDRVIVEGLQHIAPGALVTATDKTMNTTPEVTVLAPAE